MSEPSILLKEGRESPLLRRHPWVYSGSVEQVTGSPGLGETVEIRTRDGRTLGRGAYSPDSQISVRVWTFEPDRPVTEAFLLERLRRSIEARGRPGLRVPERACRLVNAESDGLPGLIVDRYGDWLVCRFLSAGPERWRDEIVAALQELTPCRGIWERSDASVREKEGLPPRTGPLAGEEPPELVEIEEGPCRFLVDLREGHKTGSYLDQRDNRLRAADFARGADVLDCFAYTGGFALQALVAGASKATLVESSSEILDRAMGNVELNDLDGERVEPIEGDVFEVLRTFRDSRRDFDLIVLDPPKFAESQSQVDAAARGYKDINLLAFKLLRPGGILVTFSCSAHVKADLYQKIVADGALDADRDARIVERLGLPGDHPTSLRFPEAGYLKGLICTVW